ncbi:hypothetical protein B7983_07270, partial [Staphylococcus aureus]
MIFSQNLFRRPTP